MSVVFKNSERIEFIKKLGIDINNLPDDFKKYNKNFYEVVNTNEKNFLNKCANAIYLPFCLKDVKGTRAIDYYNMTFFESFFKCERENSIIKRYIENSSYYWNDLKQSNPSNISPLELFRLSDGSYYIDGGNNRICFLMMMYLSEMSKATSKEEKEKINEKYTFYAKIKSIPKDEDIVGSYSILRLLYDNIQFEHIGKNPDDYSYNIKIGDLSIETKTKKDLTNIIKKLCSINDVNDPSIFYDRLSSLLIDYNHCMTNVLKGIYPDLENLKKFFHKLDKIYGSKEVFDGYDLSEVNDSNLLLFICKVIKDKTVDNIENENISFNL